MSNKQNVHSTIYTQMISLKMKIFLKIFLYSIMGPIILYYLFFSFLHYHENLTKMQIKVLEMKERKPLYRIYTRSNNIEHLKHVFIVLERLGFKQTHDEYNWDLLWAHDYPFRTLNFSMNKLKPHQRINHFPGCGYITNKVDLSTSKSRYILPAFKIPEQYEEFLLYTNQHSEKIFVQKSNNHRGISIKNISEISVTETGSFMQEFIQRPFLIDGYKFDIGIYVVITSVNPLRVYAYKDKYIIGDDYLPIWNVPSLKYYYTKLKFSMKNSFDAYVRSHGKYPEKIWNDIHEAIKEIILLKENYIIKTVKRFGNERNFFELIRIDFALDEDLNVYIMEANMSPNLSSAHYPANQLLYEQIIFNLFSLVGIGQRIRKDSLKIRNKMEERMEVADKNIMVLPELCIKCNDCFRVECQLCSPCFTPEIKMIFSQSYLEHQNKMDFQRIFPPPITKNMTSKDYTLKNQLLVRWYQGKCELDLSWCL
ncbi:probable tubulin polyglutamylase ttll-15 isoform X2 [Apis cerana]|uniref:probable tubulin polyglutamylase ttll-15 isoform X2 n=1 Tax=Apis cerana TaxID=7461 RepID=UPI0007E2C80D|nr:probable tubulin polyglutamylase ttll-15 isoform X2 [Apis cerana]